MTLYDDLEALIADYPRQGESGQFRKKIIEKIKAILDAQKTTLDDHEARIAALEGA